MQIICCFIRLARFRDLKDKLSKASSETEYKVYKREQDVRREVEADLARIKHEAEVRHCHEAHFITGGPWTVTHTHTHTHTHAHT